MQIITSLFISFSSRNFHISNFHEDKFRANDFTPFFFSIAYSPSPSHFPPVPLPSGLFSFLLPGSVQGPEASLPDAAFVKLKYFRFKHWSEPLLYQADSANTCLWKSSQAEPSEESTCMENWLLFCNPWQLGISISWLFSIYQLQLKSTFFNWKTLRSQSLSQPPQG